MIGDSYGVSLSESARSTALWLSTSALTVSVSFNQVNTAAVEAMQTNRLRLIREFSNEQRAATHQALLRGIQEGANPIEQARAFRDSIGLTKAQEAAIANYKRLLKNVGSDKAATRNVLDRALRDGRFDRTVARAAREGVALDAAQIDRMTARYREKMIKYRAEMIARTEALSSVNQGVDQMYQQAYDSGALKPEEVKEKWVSAHDARVRSSHSHLNGQIHNVGEKWQGADGELRYPGDPEAPASERIHCRCIVTRRLEPSNDNSGPPSIFAESTG
jgi:hypothetical protein